MSKSGHDCWCQESWESGCCCMYADLNETQAYVCQSCAEVFDFGEEKKDE